MVAQIRQVAQIRALKDICCPTLSWYLVKVLDAIVLMFNSISTTNERRNAARTISGNLRTTVCDFCCSVFDTTTKKDNLNYTITLESKTVKA